jgi:hypothetical protein
MVGVSGASKDINVRRILYPCSVVQLLCRILALWKSYMIKSARSQGNAVSCLHYTVLPSPYFLRHGSVALQLASDHRVRLSFDMLTVLPFRISFFVLASQVFTFSSAKATTFKRDALTSAQTGPTTTQESATAETGCIVHIATFYDYGWMPLYEPVLAATPQTTVPTNDAGYHISAVTVQTGAVKKQGTWTTLTSITTMYVSPFTTIAIRLIAYKSKDLSHGLSISSK